MLPQLKLRRRLLATVRGALLRGFRMCGQDLGWTPERGGSQDRAPLLWGGGMLTWPPPASWPRCPCLRSEPGRGGPPSPTQHRPRRTLVLVTQEGVEGEQY